MHTLVSKWPPNAIATTQGPQHQVIFRDERYSPLHTDSFSYPLALLPGAFSCSQVLPSHLGFILTWKVRVYSTNPVIPTCVLGKVFQHSISHCLVAACRPSHLCLMSARTRPGAYFPWGLCLTLCLPFADPTTVHWLGVIKRGRGGVADPVD